MKPILEVQNIWKQYKIGGKQQRYLSFREQLKNTFRPKNKKETFWALQDISFKVYEGECIGIIGRNGAGKSTLLKILSKITPPTKGQIKARGRIASLLEVGTGFHPELTGRENVYLNGSILGLRKVEIDKKFDEIVDFSGVEQFLDTPLKHYSSGMQLRLAFSVAAYLEAEILLIDEVLAVGDAEFQKRCLGKMDEVSKSGRTVLFVSHNLGVIKQLCQRLILLEKGNITNDTQNIDEGISTYLNNQEFIHHKKQWTIENAPSTKSFCILSISTTNSNGEIVSKFMNNEFIIINIKIYKLKPQIVKLRVNVFSMTEQLLFCTNSRGFEDKKSTIGSINYQLLIPPHIFNEGIYKLEITGHSLFDSVELKSSIYKKINIKKITLEGGRIKKMPGHFAPNIKWIIQ